MSSSSVYFSTTGMMKRPIFCASIAISMNSASLKPLQMTGVSLSASATTASSSGDLPAGRDVTVTSITDGDTFRAGDERVRLIGIDTPETHKPDSPVECFGAEATERLEALLPEGTGVVLVRDVEPRDRYDRLLAYVYRRDDELFVNLAMAADGYAAAYTVPPNVAHADEFVAAAAAARDADKGLWGACGGPDTPLAALASPP